MFQDPQVGHWGPLGQRVAANHASAVASSGNILTRSGRDKPLRWDRPGPLFLPISVPPSYSPGPILTDLFGDVGVKLVGMPEPRQGAAIIGDPVAADPNRPRRVGTTHSNSLLALDEQEGNRYSSYCLLAASAILVEGHVVLSTWPFFVGSKQNQENDLQKSIGGAPFKRWTEKAPRRPSARGATLTPAAAAQ